MDQGKTIQPVVRWCASASGAGKAALSMVINLLAREFDGFRASFRAQADAFHEVFPEIEVRFHFYPVEMVEEKMVRVGHPPLEVDVFLCSTDWLPQLMEGGRLLPLNDYLAPHPPENWPGDWAMSLRQLQTRDAITYGIPYHDGPEVLLYRRDWFDDAQEKAKFLRRYHRELRPPETWSEFYLLAHYFTRPQESRFGAVLAGFPDGHNLVYDFLLHLWSRGGALLAGRRPLFDQAAGQDALEYYLRLYEDALVNPACRGFDSIRAGEAFARGDAALMWNWIGFALMAESSESKVRGKVGLARLPKGDGEGGRHVTLNSYWVLTIPQDALHPDWAWRFIQFVANPAMDRITAFSGGHATRLSTWRDPEVQRRFPAYAVVEELHQGAMTLPAISQYPAINAVLNTMMTRALAGTPIRRVLHEAADEAAEILAAGDGL